ncbi:N-acetylated-alpha-linked acidic dipeptidase-like protein 2 [Pyrenochaeta sp. MPI-SDFR-AT-0127]|nr:N-acetylated-alpha-linked acidic dipeptidase-like protein 2 [Pyrenochaeta sp. MPI-SDFR-AT-0127]
MKLISIMIAAASVQACERELNFRQHQRHVQRSDPVGATQPVLNENESILLSSIDNTSISLWSRYFSFTRNVAGEDDTVPQWISKQWKQYGFKTRLDGYYVFLNYPIFRSLELQYSNGSSRGLKLEEEILDVDSTTSEPDRVPAFHGYSFSGRANAEYVYVGRGQREDFERLRDLDIDLVDKIALAKYGGPFRGLKVKHAQEYGMIGAIIFTDPGDDKNMTAANGFLTYPDGPARNPTSIQRGSVAFLSTYPGDPTTPAYPSKEDSVRTEKRTMPKIPSLPISWSDAQPLLQALNGHGIDAKEVDRSNWIGSIPGVEYSTGPALGVTLAMSNIMEDKMTWIWNTIGIINGTSEDEVVVVGNHHDAWMIGGAADPHSGSAILIELAKSFGALLETDWRPKRTIVLASWDGEEYGLIGSTEWVEEYIPWLKGAAISYLNIDVGVAGTIPDFSATPDLHALATSMAKKVAWPNGKHETLYSVWKKNSGEIDNLGAQSDYTAFLHRIGLSAMDIGTTRAPSDPIYHTHSNYDSFHWMKTYVDPDFLMHRAMCQYLTLMLYHLVDDALLPLDPSNYGPEMRAYFEELREMLPLPGAGPAIELNLLEDAITTFERSAAQFKSLRESAMPNDTILINTLNYKARDFSREFVGQGGLPGREFYQHLIFAPGLDTGYAPVTFPGITEAISVGNVTLAREFVVKTSMAILAAAEVLKS